MNELKQKTSSQLVDELIHLDQLRLNTSKSIAAYQAELQARGIGIMEDRNKQYMRFFGDEGTVSVTDSKSLDILNPDRLKVCVTEGVYKMHVKETTETKYKCTPAFERMLKALFCDDYTYEYDLEEFLDQMHILPDAKQKKTLLKRLKGDYEADRKTLCAVFKVEDDWGVELWHIHRIKNGELIRTFLPDDMLDASMRELKKCILVESKLSIKLDYEKE